MLPTRLWTEMTTRDFEDADMERVIAILPLGAVEQHGPHLPVGTDSMIQQAYLDLVLERLPEGLPVLVLPVQQIGVSQEHLDFAGTLSLSPQSALAAWLDIGACVARTGCRKLVIANAHGGHIGLMDVLARELRLRHRMLAVAASWHRFGYPDGLFSAHERQHGIHGGDIETSLMLQFRPDLVRPEELQDFVPASVDMAQTFQWLSATGRLPMGWMAQDLSESGAMGNAAAASADKGEAAADYGVSAFIELLQDVDAFDLARLVDA
jgi:creatinine amidohydrolase